MLCKWPCSTFKPLGLALYYIYRMLPDHVAMCHGFCWAAHLDAALCVCRSLRNKLARVGNHSLLQQNPAPEIAALKASVPPPPHYSLAQLVSCDGCSSVWEITLSFRLLPVWLGTKLVFYSERVQAFLLFYLQTSGFCRFRCLSVRGCTFSRLFSNPQLPRPVHAAGLRTQWSYESFITCNSSTCCHLWHRHTFQRADHISTLCVTSLFKPRWSVQCCTVTMMLSEQLFLWTLSEWRDSDLQKSHTVGSGWSIDLNTWE